MPTAFERALERAVPAVIEETVRVCEIPAPTGRERTRGRYVYDRLEAIGGWSHLEMDGLSNVVAVRKGEAGHARLLLCAHLDTVFPDEATPVVQSRGNSPAAVWAITVWASRRCSASRRRCRRPRSEAWATSSLRRTWARRAAATCAVRGGS